MTFAPHFLKMRRFYRDNKNLLPKLTRGDLVPTTFLKKPACISTFQETRLHIDHNRYVTCQYQTRVHTHFSGCRTHVQICNYSHKPSLHHKHAHISTNKKISHVKALSSLIKSTHNKHCHFKFIRSNPSSNSRVHT